MSKLVKLAKKILAFSLIFTLVSCASNEFAEVEKIDPIVDLDGVEFSDTLVKNRKKEKQGKKQNEKAAEEAPIPTVSKLISIPSTPKIGGDKTISFSVTEQVPLKDVLIELGRVTKIDVDLDPSISGGIILNAKNRPLKEVIDRIANLGQLRYSFQNGVLHFERDAPYLKNYFVDYLIDGQLWADVETNLTSIVSSNASSAEGESAAAASFSSNKSAGIISVFATEKQHEAIEKYLNDVEKVASAQVLIEAKIVEVTLKKSYNAGIDWSNLGNSSSSITNTYPGTTTASTGTASLVVTATGLLGNNLDVSVSALEKFGTVRTIASPRLHAINNQKATLNFAGTLVYFKVDASSTVTSSTSSVTSTSLTSTKQQETTGTQLNITPSINLKTSEVTLSINPKLSSAGSYITDPASPSYQGTLVVDANGDSITNTVPQMQTREINTIAKIQSGNVVIIGGVMTESTTNTDSGVPFLSRIPFLGWLFKSMSRDATVVETVILIKATIIKSNTPPTKYDRDFNNKFDSTKRPYLN